MDELLEEVTSMQHNGQASEAIELLTQYLEQHPSCMAVLLKRASVSAMISHNDDALRDYTAAIGLDPSCIRAYLGRASLLQRCGDQLEALRVLDEAVRVSPDDASDALLERARALVDLARYAEAIDDTTKALAMASSEESDNLTALLSTRASARLRLGLFEEAAADYERCLKLHKLSGSMALGLGLALLLQGKLDDAVQPLRNAQCTPGHRFVMAQASRALAFVFLNQGETKMAQHAIDKAERELQNCLEWPFKAISLPHKVDGTVYLERACLRYLQRDMAGARSDLALAAITSPTRTHARVRAIYCERQRKRSR